jgi:hypothetical protein
MFLATTMHDGRKRPDLVQLLLQFLQLHFEFRHLKAFGACNAAGAAGAADAAVGAVTEVAGHSGGDRIEGWVGRGKGAAGVGMGDMN